MALFQIPQTPPPINNGQISEKGGITLKQAVRSKNHSLAQLCKNVSEFYPISYRQIKRYGHETAPGKGKSWVFIKVILAGWNIDWG